ncbi:MAG TPA: methyltransferase [Terriglobales bacterium]|nr:methyltransferase [Terriglobales bacterium]
MEKPTLDKFPRRVLAGIDIQKAFIVSRLIVAAERVQVFRVLHGKRMTRNALGRKLGIDPLYAREFLDSLVAVGLLRKKRDEYWNSALAEKYFVEGRSVYWTRQYSRECVDAFERMTLLEKVLASGRNYESLRGRKGPSYVEVMKRDRGQAEDFTQMLFHYHREDAAELAKYLDLSRHERLLDVAGGSGVMSVALAKKNPRLRASVLDIATVCEVAKGNIRRAGLTSRVKTLAGDIRRRLPGGYDVILFSDVGPVSNQLLRNAYRSLPPGGMIVLVDRYFSADGLQPLDRLMEYFAGSSFGHASWKEMVNELKAFGFRRVKAHRFFRDVWCVTGVKSGQPRS